MVVNELLAGALRVQDEEKPIVVSLKTVADGQVELTVAGPETFLPPADGGLRGRLIATMAAQLGGMVDEAKAQDGYRFRLAFARTER